METGHRDDTRKRDTEDAPRGGMPDDRVARVADPGTGEAGVWPLSALSSGYPDAGIQPMASFGQGDRRADGGTDIVARLSFAPCVTQTGRPLPGERAIEPDLIEESLEAALDSLRSLMEGRVGKEEPWLVG